jgi:hypothetical protein
LGIGKRGIFRHLKSGNILKVVYLPSDVLDSIKRYYPNTYLLLTKIQYDIYTSNNKVYTSLNFLHFSNKKNWKNILKIL